MPKEALFTINELADYLKMRPITIYKHAAAGKLPGFKVGAAWRFKKSTIDRWIEAQENSRTKNEKKTPANYKLCDRRISTRTAAIFPVETPGGIIGETVNISETGLCFSLRKPLPSTQVATIEITLPFSSSFKSQVKVAWTHSFGKQNKFSYGANFLNLDKKKCLNLNEALANYKFLDQDFIFLTEQLHAFLLDVKDRFDKFDAENKDETKQLKFIEKNKTEIYNVLTEHFVNIWKVTQNFKRPKYKLHQKYYRNMLWYSLANATEINRIICSKPLGYAGDFTTMNYFYNFYNKYLGISSYEKLINYYSCNIPDAFSIVKRKEFFKQKILKLLNSKSPLRVLSVGSGPGRELVELTREGKITKSLHFVCLDFEKRALDYIKSTIEKIIGQKRTYLNLETVNKNLLSLIKNKDIKSNLGKYDLIYSSGLFDYFSDKVAIKALEVLYGLLDNNAMLIICNADKGNAKHRGYYEMLGDWHFNYRTKEEMLNWTKNIQCTKNIEFISQDKDNLFLFLSLKKPSA